MPEQLPLAETPTLTPPPRVARPKRRYTWTMGMGNNDIEKQQAEEIIASVGKLKSDTSNGVEMREDLTKNRSRPLYPPRRVSRFHCSKQL